MKAAKQITTKQLDAIKEQVWLGGDEVAKRHLDCFLLDAKCEKADNLTRMQAKALLDDLESIRLLRKDPEIHGLLVDGLRKAFVGESESTKRVMSIAFADALLQNDELRKLMLDLLLRRRTASECVEIVKSVRKKYFPDGE